MRSIRIFCCVWAASILLLLAAFASASEEYPAHSTPVRGQASAYRLLKSSIERHYGKAIRIEETESDNPDYCGETSVTRDGTPIIRVNARIAHKEEVVVHEMLHLQLRKNGYPRYVLACPDNLALDRETMAALSRMVNNMRDVIEHHVFLFPAMERMELDPYTNMRAIYRRNLESGYVRTFDNPVYQAFNYMKISLESNDPVIQERLDNCYRSAGWQASLEKGRRLVEAVKQRKITGPGDEVALSLYCLNTLFADRIVFRALRWGTTGSPAREAVISILVRPSGA